MNSAVRWIVLPVFLFGVVTTMSVRAEDASAAKSPTNKPAGQAAQKPRVLVTISKETTYITEPLRPDGYPDYVAALNQICSKGVTPENNAAVLFWKAVGPGEILPPYRETYFQMLGVSSIPEKGDYFVTSDAWIKRLKAKEKPDAKQPELDYNDPLWEQQSQTTKRPWSQQEFPVWAEWLAVNEKPLALLVEASKRPRRYDPMFGGMVIAVLLPAAQQHRDVSRALVARAMLQVHEDKSNEAWDDLMACHRLARLVGQGPTLIDALVGITIDGIACAGDKAFLQHAKLTAAQIGKMRADLAKLPPMPKMTDKIDISERFMFLDCVSVVARGGPSAMSELVGTGKPDSVIESLIHSVGSVMIDWDIVLRMGNSWFDRFADTWRKPTPTERKKVLDAIDADIKSLAKSTRDLKSLGLSMLFNPCKAISERIGQAFVCLLLPGLSACTNAEDRWTMQFELTKLAFALAAYRAEHGAYPAKLADLAPKYFAEVPKDMFNDAELHYRPDGSGYLLYSVGINGKDDGGTGYDDRKVGDADSDDLAVRMPAAAKQPEKR